MKHRLLFTLLLGGMALGASAQKSYTILQDLTSQLQNADFSADTPVGTTIRTYDYDMPDNGAGSGEEGAIGLFGMQPVTGWTASVPTDNTMVSEGSSNARTDGLNARASGIFAYDDESGSEIPGLGGNYFPPYMGEGVGTQGLGMVAVWGASLTYSQSVSLLQGAYMMIVKQQNTSGAGTVTNLTGVKISDTESYLSKKTTFPAQVWEEDTITFRLAAAANATVQLGFSFSGGSGSAPHLFIDNVKLYKIDEQQLIQEEIDAKKVELLEQIEIGRSYNVDTSDAQAVYDNPNATMEQVIAAIEAQKNLNEHGTTDLSEAFITNPHFTQDEPVTGGICTYDRDMTTNNVNFFGSQPLFGWKTPDGYESDNVNRNVGDANPNGRASGVFTLGDTAFLGGKGYQPPATLSDGVTTEGSVLGFVTCWSKTVQYTQNVTLPVGKYTLTLSYYNTGGSSAISKNLIGFVEDNGTEHLGEKVTFPLNEWTKEVIEFELFEETTGYFSMGYTATDTGSGNMPHFFTDGISLIYVGTGIDASFLALQSAVSGGHTLLDEVFNADLKSQFEAAVDAGQDLINEHSSDAEANKAATAAIKEMLADVNASINAYKRLQEFADGDLINALDKYEHTEPALWQQLSEIDDDVQEQLGDQGWNNEQIDEAIASLNSTIKTYIQEKFDAAVASGEELANDLDISILYETLGVTYSTGEAKNTAIPDKQWVYGDASNFKTQYGAAEVWNQSPFTVSQTMTDMPAGTYTLKVRGFYRTADQQTNYDTYNPDSELAFLFAGHQKSALTNIAEIASSDPEEFIGAATINETLYVPNSMQSAHDVFGKSLYDEKLLKEVKTVLTETGDLVFGITAEQMEENCWVIWDTFELYYNALDNDLMASELEALIEDASNMFEEEAVVKIKKAYTDLETSIGKGEAALEGSADAQKAAIHDLKEAIAYAKGSSEVLEKLYTTADEFATLRDQYGYASSSSDLDDAISSISGEYDSNEAVEEAINSFPAAWAKYVLGQDMTGASEEAPIDITGIILNPDFETENANYWTIDEEVGQNQGYQGASYEGESTISKFIEVWRKSAVLNDGDVSQELAAVLPEGYYCLEVDGHAMWQDGWTDEEGNTYEEEIIGASLMAKVGNSMNLTSMAVAGTTANPQHFVLNFYSDGKSPVTVGLHVEGTNANWLAADNFKLSYIGTEAPTSIETVENVNELDLLNATIYNLAGQRLSAPQRGVNIINGKKVFVK